MVRNIKKVESGGATINVHGMINGVPVVKEYENEYEQLLDMLTSYKYVKGSDNQEENILYSIELEAEKAKCPPSNLKLENIINIFLQFNLMRKNYHRFPELLFVD